MFWFTNGLVAIDANDAGSVVVGNGIRLMLSLVVQLQYMCLMVRQIDGHVMPFMLHIFMSTISVIRHK